MEQGLQGKSCVVVGASSGLGKEIALILAEAKARLLLVGRNSGRLDEVAQQAVKKGAEVKAVVADATRPEAVNAFLRTALAEYGAIDALVNCQGESQILYFEALSDAEWDRVVTTNLSSVVYTCRFAFDQMKRQGGGHIINIGSQASLTGSSQAAAYLAAKAGVEGLGKALAHEGRAFGIRVTTVCPGPMNTPMRWNATPDMPRETLLDPKEVAALVAQVLSYPTMQLTGPVVPILGPSR